jgi:hypothetical protein
VAICEMYRALPELYHGPDKACGRAFEHILACEFRHFPTLVSVGAYRATSALAKRSMNDAHDRSKRAADRYQPSMRKRASTDAPLVTKIREGRGAN